MRNLNRFFNYLNHKDIELELIDGALALTEMSKEPDQEIMMKIKTNKELIVEYLALNVDRTKPCQSSISGCVYSMPSLGCMNSKHKNLIDKYQEDCKTCESFTKPVRLPA